MDSIDLDADYLLNFFNIPKANSKSTPIPASPSPSAQSENSVECNQNTNDAVVSTDDDSEQELTNLTWLTQLKNLAAWPDLFNRNLDENVDDMNKPKVEKTANLIKKDSAADRYTKFIEQIVKCKANYDNAADFFQSNAEVKPIFNYAEIIAMAMHENGRMTLQQICSWINRKFAYFRGRTNWNNSIRHNLSLNYCFRKIDRSKYEKGKGGYWELAMDETKYEKKRVRNRKPRLTSTKDETDDSPQAKKIKISQDLDSLEEKDAIQEFFTQEHLKDFNLETNLAVASLTDNTFNSIEQNQIVDGEQHFLENQGDLSTTTYELQQSSLDVNDLNNSTDDLVNNQTIGITPSKQFSVSSTLEMLDEEFPSVTLVDPTASDIQGEAIYLTNEVPQPIENVVVSILNNYPCEGPNVIVEPIPYTIPAEDNSYKPDFSEIDEEFQFLRNCDIDSFYDFATNDF